MDEEAMRTAIERFTEDLKRLPPEDAKIALAIGLALIAKAHQQGAQELHHEAPAPEKETE